jgi:peptidoglycan hydrolase-like protein with peptidoglycan-binding domain
VRRPSTAVLTLTALALALAGCSAGGTTADLQAVAAPVSASPSASPSDLPSPSPSPSPSPLPSSSPSASPSVSPSPAVSVSPKPPRATYDVAAVQRTLTEQKYYVGAADGRPGPTMKSAVMAFQKVHGLPADGTVGAGTLAALAAPRQPALKGGPGNRVEVDLTKQVMYVVKGGSLVRILPVSSGNGATYAQKSGGKARALTPVGHYKIERRIVGERKADLGILYDPQYFYRGWAIHGSNSVPAGPASHGCVRVTRPDAKYLLGVLSNGMDVHLYGGTHIFSAGSAAPGTDSPTGDGAAPAPAPAPATKAPAPAPAPATKAPAPASPPAPTTPAPSASTPPTTTPSPSPSPSASAAGTGTS